jgi:phosphonate transport system substrate-binding protein
MVNKSFFFHVKWWLLILSGVLFCHTSLGFAESYRFGVVNRHSVIVTAAMWNLVLAWVQRQTGIELTLHMGITSKDTVNHLKNGKYDFFYGYPMLHPDVREKSGYRTILMTQAPDEVGAIVAASSSGIQTLSDLKNVPVDAMTERNFIAGFLPRVALQSQGVLPKFHIVSNLESLKLGIKSGLWSAALVNLSLFRDELMLEEGKYRVLWQSPPVPSLPIGVQNSVPVGVAQRIQQALAGMHQDAEGREILNSVRERFGHTLAGWSVADDEDYRFAIDLYRVTMPVSSSENP